MLKTGCINPLLVEALAFCGHGDKVLLVDGNYPLAARSGEAKKIFLGVKPGLPTVPQVLEALCSIANFEKVEAMVPDDGSTPEALKEVRAVMQGMPLDTLDRFAFYDAACEPDVCVAISTGEDRTYACLLLTVGVV
ncbi:RbsD/FucU family protein [Anaerotruncus rubiinfantis]|uniref:RbsD/FucU family protein n=1 Tax=Anaerotruncus rubiinfantis TaxID=1720200 RepID=UPI0011CA0E25|nr:RbsD/FucU family protein [Anaerotruncus rubiinfantis]